MPPKSKSKLNKAKLTATINAAIASPSVHAGLYTCDQITLHAELRHWLPERPEEDLHSLEKDILTYGGVRDALLVWPHEGKMILIDGYTRYRVAKKNGLKFRISMREFASLDEVKLWMIDNQNNQRRNSTPLQKAYHIGWEYERVKHDKTSNLLQLIMPMGKNYPSDQVTDNQAFAETSDTKGKNYPSERTSAIIADRNHLSSEKTVRIYHSVFLSLEAIKKVNKDLFHDIFTGKQDINIGTLEKLAVKEIPDGVEKVADLQALLRETKEKEKEKSSEKQVITEYTSKLKSYSRSGSEKDRAELIKWHQKQIDKLKGAKG